MLDWGTVPSWVSAGSFAIGLGVFWRDHLLRVRKQAESLGAWAEVEEPDASDLEIVGNTRIYIKNSSDLPIYIAFISYRSVICCVDDERRDEEMYPLFRQAVATDTFPDGEYVEPGETAQSKMYIYAGDGMKASPYYGNRVLGSEYAHIRAVWFSDSAGRRWKVSPQSGRSPKRVRLFRWCELVLRYPYPESTWHRGLRKRLVIFVKKRRVDKMGMRCKWL